MGKNTCRVDECANPAKTRGLCGKHYARLLRHGDPLAGGVPRFSDPEDTFSARVRPDGGCLIWAGTLNGQGYGRLRVGGESIRAHRYAWERANGPIPEGMYVDHICHKRACVEVAHLRLATHSENEANRAGADKRSRLGIRNVRKEGRLYYVRVTCGDRDHRATFGDLDAAERDAAAARARLFGDFAGGA